MYFKIMKELLTVLILISFIALVSTLFIHSHHNSADKSEYNCPVCILCRTLQNIIIFNFTFAIILQVLAVLQWTISIIPTPQYFDNSHVRAPPVIPL